MLSQRLHRILLEVCRRAGHRNSADLWTLQSKPDDLAVIRVLALVWHDPLSSQKGRFVLFSLVAHVQFFCPCPFAWWSWTLLPRECPTKERDRWWHCFYSEMWYFVKCSSCHRQNARLWDCQAPQGIKKLPGKEVVWSTWGKRLCGWFQEIYCRFFCPPHPHPQPRLAKCLFLAQFIVPPSYCLCPHSTYLLPCVWQTPALVCTIRIGATFHTKEEQVWC